MPIQCKICDQLFPNLITSSHLAKHNVKTHEYIQEYGKLSLASDEYRLKRSNATTGAKNPNYGNTMADESKDAISAANKNNIPWNKGTKIADTSAYIKGATKREHRYQTGELTRHSLEHTADTRAKIAKGVRDYANKASPEQLSARAKKAVATKRNSGVDLAFFKGKSHSADAKAKISEASIKTNAVKSERATRIMVERIHQAGLGLIGSEGQWVQLRCNTCLTDFSHTKQMFHLSKYTTDRCPKCYPVIPSLRSQKEIALFEYVQTMCPDAQSNFKYDGKKELDIYVPSLNIGIEFNGLYWHSEQVLTANGKSKTSDFEKYTAVTQAGIRYLCIFEDEWDNSQDIVKARLRHILGCSTSKVYARKCSVQEISSKTASAFCNTHHIQRAGRSNARFGLYHQDQLVAVMTFSKNNISRKVHQWELNRFCTDNDAVIGGASKLFCAFIAQYAPDTVVTYADQRWSNGNLYSTLGFVFSHASTPSYWYIRPNDMRRYHRYSLRKNKNDTPKLTEWENRQMQGWNRIWDCGHSKWTWSSK